MERNEKGTGMDAGRRGEDRGVAIDWDGWLSFDKDVEWEERKPPIPARNAEGMMYSVSARTRH